MTAARCRLLRSALTKLRVRCGTLEGTMRPHKLQVVLQDGRVMEMGEFEKAGGRGSSKKWRMSVRVLGTECAAGTVKNIVRKPSRSGARSAGAATRDSKPSRTQGDTEGISLGQYCQEYGVPLPAGNRFNPFAMRGTDGHPRIYVDIYGERGPSAVLQGKYWNHAQPTGDFQPITDWLSHELSGIPTDWTMKWFPRSLAGIQTAGTGDWYFYPPEFDNGGCRSEFRSSADVRRFLIGDPTFSEENCAKAAGMVGAAYTRGALRRKMPPPSASGKPSGKPASTKSKSGQPGSPGVADVNEKKRKRQPPSILQAAHADFRSAIYGSVKKECEERPGGAAVGPGDVLKACNERWLESEERAAAVRKMAQQQDLEKAQQQDLEARTPGLEAGTKKKGQSPYHKRLATLLKTMHADNAALPLSERRSAAAIMIDAHAAMKRPPDQTSE